MPRGNKFVMPKDLYISFSKICKECNPNIYKLHIPILKTDLPQQNFDQSLVYILQQIINMNEFAIMEYEHEKICFERNFNTQHHKLHL